MRKFLIAVAATGLVLAGSVAGSRAALPPIHDRVRQFQAVLETDGLAQALAAHGLIDRIVRTGELTFRAYSGDCFVAVKLTAVPPPSGMVGPTRYEGTLGETGCR